MAKDAADSLLDGILGNANPGDSGNDDNAEGTGGDSDLSNQEHDEPEGEDDTGAVTDDEDNGDHDSGDAGSDADDDEIAAKARKARGGDDKDGKAPKADPKADADPFNSRAEHKTDKLGNVYANGKMVARAGREARNYMNWRKAALADRSAAMNAHKRLNQVALGAQELVARYDELKKSRGALDNLQLTPQEQSQLIQVAAAFKKNPVDGIKLLLTQAHLAGVDLKSVVGANTPLDMKALTEQFKGEIQAMLKPVLDQTSAREKQDKLREEANGLFDRNPRAEVVAEILGGAHQLGKLLAEAKRRAPDVHIDELFQRLDYAMLQQGITAPVTRRRPDEKQRRKMDKNFSRQIRLSDNSSFEDIASSVMADVRAAESRGI